MNEISKEKELIFKVKYFLDKTFDRENREKSLRSLFNMPNETLRKVISDFKKIDLRHFQDEQERTFFLEALEKVQGLKNKMEIYKTFVDYLNKNKNGD